MKFEERATMSAEIIGPSGYINASMQKQPERVATDHPYPTPAGNANPIAHSAEETISLTSIAAQKTETSLASVSVVNNQKKIEKIKQLLLEGSYQIDSKSIADKLIALELALSK
jgi:negative regulator of flagellin synthesis FlgM